jgi:hypothetical protein
MSRPSTEKGLIMFARMLCCLAAFLPMVFSGSVLADDAENTIVLKRLQTSLAVINSELKSDLDQVLMLQEAIKANARTPLETQGRSPDPVMVEDAAAAQRRAIQRETAINVRLDAILARSAALDAKKQPLLERLRELSVAQPPVAAKP